MNILQNRIESFQTSMVKWPHTGSQFQKIETFAKAGFYFVRRPKYPDSVRCFLCDIELSNWRPGQSPFTRHTHDSPNCALQWLNYPDLNRKVIASNKKDPATDPRGTTMRTARLATFSNHNYWPPNKNILPKKRYPSGAKLADAGFIFSPTVTQVSRIKCPYCRLTIDEPSINDNLFLKHQELSHECEFFSLTSNMRATRSRRDTIDSSHSHDTFATAQSHPEDDGTMTEPVKRKVSFTSNQPSSQDLKQSSENKQKSKRQRIVKEKLEDIPIVTVDSLIDAEPIKIVSRKKSTETSTTGTQSIASHKLGVSTKKAGSKTDVWDIDNAFSLPTISRRSNVTFGKPSMGRRTLASEKAVVFGVDVFSNVKKPLNTTLDKKEDKQIITHKVHTTATTRKKSQKLDHIESLAQPMKSNRRDDDTTDQPKTIKKRSLSSSRNSTNTTNKDLHLKVVVDKKPESPKLTVDSFIFKDGRVLMEERKSKEPESPNLMTDSSTFDHSKKRDKGKGRAVEHNITPPIIRKTKLSLSKSKNKKLSTTSNFKSPNDLSNNDQLPRLSGEPSTSGQDVEMVPVVKIKHHKLPKCFIVDTPFPLPRSPSPDDFKDIPALPGWSALKKRITPLLAESPPMMDELGSPASPTHENPVHKPSVQAFEVRDSPESPDPDQMPESPVDVYKELSPELGESPEIEQTPQSPVYKDFDLTPELEQSPESPMYDNMELAPEFEEIPQSTTNDDLYPFAVAYDPSGPLTHEELFPQSPVYDNLESVPQSEQNSPVHDELSPELGQVNHDDIFSPDRQRTFSPLRSPTIDIVSQGEMASRLISSPPRSTIANMSFMQSTPSTATDNHGVSALELFGPNPLSPITHMHKHTNHALQYTPAIPQSSRTRRVFDFEEIAKLGQESPVPEDDKITVDGETSPIKTGGNQVEADVEVGVGAEVGPTEVVAEVEVGQAEVEVEKTEGEESDTVGKFVIISAHEGVQAIVNAGEGIIHKLYEFEEIMRCRYHELGIDT